MFDFMKNIVAWINAREYFYKNGRDQLESCFVLNFGYLDELPYPSITVDMNHIKIFKRLASETPARANFIVPGTRSMHSDNPDMEKITKGWGMNLPSSCSIVIISGKYLEIIDNVMLIVDAIAEDIDHVPLATFLISNSENISFDDLKKVDISTDQRFDKEFFNFY